jgi:hypothetical protein
MPKDDAIIEWNPPVSQSKLRRLYESDARGLLDTDTLEDVGISLYLRCQSIVVATEALSGRAACMDCGTIILHRCIKHEQLQCPSCGWSLPWYKYRRAAERLRAGGAMPAYRAFLTAYPQAHSPRAKLLLIDQLIHAFHWETKHGPLRPAGTSLIEGSMPDVVRFLDDLSAGPESAPELHATKAQWQQKLIEAAQNYPWIQQVLDPQGVPATAAQFQEQRQRDEKPKPIEPMDEHPITP